MGIDIAAYRMRIGLYLCPNCGRSKATIISCSKCFPVGVMLRIFCVVATIGIALTKCGDIESNPGPGTGRICSACRRYQKDTAQVTFFSFPSGDRYNTFKSVNEKVHGTM